MRLRQEARVLKGKALSSLVSATEAFNSPRDDGRVTRVLLHLQHAFEMLLKAGLIQADVSVFDRRTGRSIGFEKCVSLAMADGTVKLSEADAGTLRRLTRYATTSSTGSTRCPSSCCTCMPAQR
jgi:hypothetical protein